MKNNLEGTKIVEGTKEDYKFIYEAENTYMCDTEFTLIGKVEDFEKLKEGMLKQELYLNPVYQEEYPQAPYKNVWELFEAVKKEHPKAKILAMRMTPWDLFLESDYDGEERELDEDGEEIDPLKHYFEFFEPDKRVIKTLKEAEMVDYDDEELAEDCDEDYDPNHIRFLKEITMEDFMEVCDRFDNMWC